MIKVDKEKTIIKGTMAVLCAEIATLFKSINQVLDKSDELKKIAEECIVCDDETYKEFCKLAVRSNEAYKRAKDKKVQIERLKNDN